MKKILSTMAAFVLAAQMCLFPAYAAPEWPNDTGVLAEGGIVIDADSGAMLFGQNVRLQYYPASITKLLTALVVLENASLDEQVNFSYEAVYDVEEGSGNKVGLEEGDVLSVEDCLYAMLLMSSNQAANALAEHVGGSRQGFVDMMNARIAQIGCTGSQFRNPSGLNDPEQVVTPYDMAMIAREAFDNEALLEIASARSYRLPATINNPEGRSLTAECRILNTTDPDSQYYFPDAVAAKTGYTSLAGNTLVLYAERDGRSVISVVLKGSQPQYYFDSISLLDFGLRQFQNVNILEHDPGFPSGEEPVTIGDRTFAPSELSMDADAVITIPDDAAFTDAVRSVVTELPSYAPAGAVALIQYHYNDRKVGEVYLLSRRRQRRLQPRPRRHRQETGKRQNQTRMQLSLMRRPNRQSSLRPPFPPPPAVNPRDRADFLWASLLHWVSWHWPEAEEYSLSCTAAPRRRARRPCAGRGEENVSWRMAARRSLSGCLKSV